MMKAEVKIKQRELEIKRVGRKYSEGQMN